MKQSEFSVTKKIVKNIKVTAKYLLLLLLGLCLFVPPVWAEDQIMHFPDRNLEAAVRHALNRPTGILLPEHMLELVTLEATRQDIQELTGLEEAINLETLSLYGNRVENLAPLARLNSLSSLNLYHNRVVNLSPLSGLTGLESLYLGGNRITDLAPLASLTGLKELYLFENNIRNISPLSTLTNLETLNLNHNSIIDFSPMGKLAGNLERLSILGNRYQNVAFLKPLTGLLYLELGSSVLEDITSLSALTQLENLTISGSKVSDLGALAPLLSLEWLSLENNRIIDVTPLAGLSELEYLNLNNNWLRNINELAELENLVWLELRNNLLDVENDTPELKIIRDLLARDITVSYEPQLLPRFRGDAAVWIPAHTPGKLFQTGSRNYFTILNHSLGWRIQSFTVEHEGGAPGDYLREIGRYDLGAGSFAWYATPGRHQPNVKDAFPYTVTFRKPSSIQLALSVMTWPGYPDNDERLFYISQISLYNIHTESLYTIEMERPAEAPADPTPEEEPAVPLRIETID